VTEVPEHLLRRSRERRAALGLGGDAPDEGGAAPAPAASAEGEGGGGSAPVPAAAPAAPAVPDVPPPPPPPPYVAETQRQRIPFWVMPALVALPFWAIIYFGAFGERETAEAAPPDGAALYSSNCASCHGAAGEGAGGFPALAGDSVELTFPEAMLEDHVTWVKEGSASKARGTPYGDPARPGGQRTVQFQGMPPFAGQLSDEEIRAIVQYEREGL
jgi:mono/diheme cytochrome c family protein